jgi:isoleucyl-tRNA synthetase
MMNESDVLAVWQTNALNKTLLAAGNTNSPYIFYDGPPFANGSPHYGHIVASCIKDVIPRYHAMQGHFVPRRWGWDCHGLPVENLVEKELGLKSKKDIVTFGLEKFNEQARVSIMKDVDEWKQFIPRLGRCVDMDNDYKTMDPQFTESVWWVFGELYKKGLIEESYKSMHVCPHCETAISNFEVSQGYKDIKDISVFVELPLVDELATSLLVWTTTPWTLPGNTAAAVHPDMQYVRARVGEKSYIVAQAKLSLLGSDAEVLEEMQGTDLVGKHYVPPFPEALSLIEQKPLLHTVLAAEYVTSETGTGIVHLAPAYGAEDLALAQKMSVPIFHHVQLNGEFVQGLGVLSGLHVKPKGDHMATDVVILKELQQRGLLFKKESLMHSYPHCWRCDSPLLNYATTSWFVKVTQFKERLVAANKTVKWVPQSIGEYRFGNWLEDARDWSISRARFWGAPLPVWRSATGETVVVSSKEQLFSYEWTSEKPDPQVFDFHRPFIDKVVLCIDGAEYTRVPEVFDCWFESGSMPYGQHGYTGTPLPHFDPYADIGFPADFIAEGVDQTRGWFYALLVLSVALFDKAPFKNVIVNGLVLAEDGQKMSKRLKNYPDPLEVVDKLGADALRYYLMTSPVVRGEDLHFSEKGVQEVRNKVVHKLQNIASFYALHPYEGGSESEPHILDTWIYARLAHMATELQSGFAQYRIDIALRPLGDFIDDLSTWYVRRSRERMKEGEVGNAQARKVLRDTLRTLAVYCAPVMPFVSDSVFNLVRTAADPISVHTMSIPAIGIVNVELLEHMQLVRSAVSVLLEMRVRNGIKVRQPLALAHIPHTVLAQSPYAYALSKIVCEEVNLKDVVFTEAEKEYFLDTTLTPALVLEGKVRDLLRAVQEVRKEMGMRAQDSARMQVYGISIELLEAARVTLAHTARIEHIDVVSKSLEDAREVVCGDESFSMVLY